MYLILCFVFSLCIFSEADKLEISPSLSKVWGPGLTPEEIVMPARYFFIQAVDIDNTAFNATAGDVFDVTIKGKDVSGRGRQPWVQVFDRGDGLYIVRYKLYSTLRNLEIHILHEGKHVSDSPYKFPGPVYNDNCKCPSPSLEDWLRDYKCPESYKRIEKDLKLFPKVRFNKIHQTAVQRFDQPGSMSICNYVIKDNEVYRKCYGQHVGFKMFVDAILLSMARKVIFPPLEILVNLGDWPLSSPAARPAIPLFSWCGSEETIDIHMPTYDLTQSTLQCMGQVMLDMLSVQGNANLPWEEREPQAFWRGRDSRRERLKLIELSRKHPTLLNASITNFFFYKNEEEEYGPKVKHISFFEFFKYKYQINVDGSVAAYRLPYLLAGGSLVFKQESRYHEHFYDGLVAFVHYVPVKADLSDLIDRIKWALDNDALAKQIAHAGRKFAQENLLSKDVFCYHGRLFQEWSRRLVDPVEVRPGMEHVPQPQETIEPDDCDCQRKREEASPEVESPQTENIEATDKVEQNVETAQTEKIEVTKKDEL